MTKDKTKVKTYQKKAIKLVAIGEAMSIYDIGLTISLWQSGIG